MYTTPESTAAKGRKRKAHAEKASGEVDRVGDDPGGQVQYCEADDGMHQMRQTAAGEADRFRVTFETSQMVRNQFKLSEAPEVIHGRPVLMVPGFHMGGGGGVGRYFKNDRARCPCLSEQH